MKVLEVGSLHSGIDEILDKIGTQKEQMNQIKEAVTKLIALEDSLKGAGGNAIRGFYEECHKPFLLFYENFLIEYEQTLNTIKSSLTGFEPSNNGFIRQSFLEHELNNGLNHAKSVTMELTDEANSVMDSVSDIVGLPHLQDQSFLESAEEAKMEKERTIERLLEYDIQQTKNLDTVEQDIKSMNQYITHIASLFQSGDLQVGEYKTGQLLENLSCFNTTGLNKLLSYGQPVQISSQKTMINGQEIDTSQQEQQEYGKEVEGSGGWQEGLSNVLDFVPIASNIKGGVEALFGKDFITGREIGDVERGILAAAIVGGPIVKAGVKAGKWGMKGIKWINAHYGDDVVKGLMKVKNALHPDRVKAVAKNATDSISHTISQVKDFTKGMGKKIRDYELPGFELVTNNGVKLSDNKTVGEVVDRTKENILRLAKKVESAVVGKVDGKNGAGGKEIDNVKYGEQFTKVNRKKTLKPNVKYSTKEGYGYTTDDIGRISIAEAKLKLGKANRNSYAQRIVGREDRLPNDDGGHLIASIFKGSGDIDNLVPMNSTLNRSEYKTLENTWKKALEDGREVTIKVKPIYEGQSVRPSEFKINYSINGKKYSDRLTNYPGGKRDGN